MAMSDPNNGRFDYPLAGHCTCEGTLPEKFCAKHMEGISDSFSYRKPVVKK